MKELFSAIEDGDIETIKSLVGANPSILNSTADEYGFSPLMCAIVQMERNFEIIKYLVASGANVKYSSKEGYTALHVNMDLNGPSGSGELPYKIAQLLVEHGADIEARNHYGWTPLLRAALEGTVDEFKALLQLRAKHDLDYSATAMPAFTRGRSMASIILPQPEKVSALLEAGFVPDERLVTEGLNTIGKAREPGSDFTKKVTASLGIINQALKKTDKRT